MVGVVYPLLIRMGMEFGKVSSRAWTLSTASPGLK